MATETLSQNFANLEFEPATPVRPVSSRPNIRTPSRASFSESNEIAPSRPKTSHVSSRRRWRSPPKEQEISPEEEIDVPIPASPKLKPTTHIYR